MVRALFIGNSFAHQIQGEADFMGFVGYIHYNPTQRPLVHIGRLGML